MIANNTTFSVNSTVTIKDRENPEWSQTGIVNGFEFENVLIRIPSSEPNKKGRIIPFDIKTGKGRGMSEHRLYLS